MVTAQTPLLGQENTPLHTMTDGRTGFEGATPCHSIAFTPNPLTTPLRQCGPYGPSQMPHHSIAFTPNLLATPLHQCGPYDPSQMPQSEAGMTVGATPMHDSLSINTEDASSGFMESKRALKLRFTSLHMLEAVRLTKSNNNFV